MIKLGRMAVVNKQNPCPICKKTDWCMIGDVRILCNREPSSHPNPEGGWFHPKEGPIAKLPKPPPKPQGPTINSAGLMREWQIRTPVSYIDSLAKELGVSEVSLYAVDAAYAPPYGAYAFPMRDGYGDMVGIRLRASDGRKWAVRGSRQGIFIPQGDLRTPIFVCEGPTDTAAALTIGLSAVGRPSCNGGLEEIRTVCRQRRIKDVVIVADRDDPGQQGAHKIAGELRLRCALWTPGAKDLRRWVNLGGTREQMEEHLKNLVWINYGR